MRLSVIGWPIEHSLSPAMHTAALRRLAEAEPAFARWRYEREAVAPADLPRWIMATRGDRDRAGFNVTLPHKVAVAPLLDRLTPSAERIGAVNTVIRQGDALVGDNTDAAGLMRSLEEAGIDVDRLDGTPVVLGAGGAARAAVIGLLDRGASAVHVAARDAAKAESLARLGGPKASHGPLTRDALLRLTPSLILQASSASMDPQEGRALAERVPLEAFQERGLAPAIVELVYRPRATPLLERARSMGLPAVDGIGMLVHQGALALTAWTGRDVDVAAMRAAVLDALASTG